MTQYGAYITYREYFYLGIEADSPEEAKEIAERNLDQAEVVGDDEYEIEIEEIE